MPVISTVLVVVVSLAVLAAELVELELVLVDDEDDDDTVAEPLLLPKDVDCICRMFASPVANIAAAGTIPHG